jgi:hypothetical protein
MSTPSSLAAAALERGAHHRVPDVRRHVEDRAERLHVVGREPLGVDPAQPVGVQPAHRGADVAEGVCEVQHAALAELEVGSQVVLEPLPELQRVLVDRRALVPQVVRTDDRGVPRHVAAGQPALLEHADVGDPVVLREVVGRGQTVPAAADDHDVVSTFRLGGTPVRGSGHRVILHKGTGGCFGARR